MSSQLPVAIIIGLPVQLRPRLEAAFRDVVEIKPLFLARDGGWILELVPRAAADFVEGMCLDDALIDIRRIVLALPYVDLPAEVAESLQLLTDVFQVTVIKPKSNDDGWPAKPYAFDNTFQSKLLTRVVVAIREALNLPAPVPPEPDPERQTMCDLLRGLITHHKMGPNNHSFEDDFWKCRAQGMRPNERHRIEMKMIAMKLIKKKKNNSDGGNGWVYWVHDIHEVRARFPELLPYLDQGKE